ncbi:response regulator transcription factor [Vallitalea guaymasensis]|uniref:Stage 0 sporulation protein A homolog n=1 Tax=Vallitalea guaymasensis TaxID=1185412 RepID=A0A8J8MF57_9FIRM|nr:response regulator transcription factor [Vallitalea guaymasensis]QUH31490.1 response regulator transcription factor [Vallitalea guaymasensis]
MEDINVLVVEDEKEISELIKKNLENEGFNIYQAYDGQIGLDMALSVDIQIVILDIMLPNMDGLEVCRQIRLKKNVPIIMLSAKSQDIDKVVGLSIGADDYLCKPFNMMELTARIRSQLRRYLYLNNTSIDKDNTIIVNDLLIDLDSHVVSIGDNEIKLTPTEYDILVLLAHNRGKVYSSEKIFEKIWDDKYYEANNNVMVHIRNIREKLNDNSKNPRYIKTIWGVGYKIEK